jgi:hypothetical protein
VGDADAALLDAYSASVAAAVDRVAPAVAHLRMQLLRCGRAAHTNVADIDDLQRALSGDAIARPMEFRALRRGALLTLAAVPRERHAAG